MFYNTTINRAADPLDESNRAIRSFLELASCESLLARRFTEQLREQESPQTLGETARAAKGQKYILSDPRTRSSDHNDRSDRDFYLVLSRRVSLANRAYTFRHVGTWTRRDDAGNPRKDAKIEKESTITPGATVWHR